MLPKCALGDWLWGLKRRLHILDMGLVCGFDEWSGRAQSINGDEVVGSVAATKRLTTSREMSRLGVGTRLTCGSPCR